MSEPILIVGGGIGGLTAALSLLRQGFKVAVFEQSAAIGDVGAGISLGVTACKGLYSLGLEAALSVAGDRPQSSTTMHYQTGAPLGGDFADRSLKAEDLPYMNQIHRADLFAVLKAAVDACDPQAVHLDHAFVGFGQDSDGVTAIFANGRRVRGAALIGSDGLRSTVRAQLFGDGSPRFTGQIVYRFLVPMDKAAPYMTAKGGILYVAPRRSLLRYRIRHQTTVNCVAFTCADDWTGEGWSERVPSDELVDLFAGWHPDVIGLARNAPLEGTAKWALYDRDPIAVWAKGRVALLGDAAHPMLPFLGLGAAMAIEDGVVLGRAFKMAATPQKALKIYERGRSERAGAMLLESRYQSEILRDGPNSTKRSQIPHRDRINYDPSTAPLETA